MWNIPWASLGHLPWPWSHAPSFFCSSSLADHGESEKSLTYSKHYLARTKTSMCYLFYSHPESKNDLASKKKIGYFPAETIAGGKSLVGLTFSSPVYCQINKSCLHLHIPTGNTRSNCFHFRIKSVTVVVLHYYYYQHLLFSFLHIFK